MRTVSGSRSPISGLRSPVGGRRGRDPEGGYNLVMLAVAVTVLNIALAAALPVWSHAMQREREEELISRGLQYAEAIRVFQNRFGRLPVRLEELIETEPRSIRQLWKDPITDSLDWGLVIAGGGGAEISPDQGRPPGSRPNPADPASAGGTPGSGPNLPRGPIQGVHSRSTESSVKVFLDRQQYDQWKFTLSLVTGVGGFGQSGGGGQTSPDPQAKGGMRLQLPLRWIGRPFPPGIEPGTGSSGVPPSDGGPGRGRS